MSNYTINEETIINIVPKSEIEAYYTTITTYNTL